MEQSKFTIKSKNGDVFEIDPKDYPNLKFSDTPVYDRKTKDELLIDLAISFCQDKISAGAAMRAFVALVLPQPEPTQVEIDYAKSLKFPSKHESCVCKDISKEEATEFFKLHGCYPNETVDDRIESLPSHGIGSCSILTDEQIDKGFKEI